MFVGFTRIGSDQISAVPFSAETAFANFQSHQLSVQNHTRMSFLKLLDATVASLATIGYGFVELDHSHWTTLCSLLTGGESLSPSSHVTFARVYDYR